MEFHIKCPYDPSNPVQVEFTKPSMVKRAFKDECNINTIMDRYQKTGLVDHVNTHQGHYGDFSDLPDYQAALNAVIIAEDTFSSLPSSLRKRFNNDPATFLDFVQNEENIPEMERLGLIPKPNKKEADATDIAAGVQPASANAGPQPVVPGQAAPAASQAPVEPS